jgi:hypothetical protein
MGKVVLINWPWAFLTEGHQDLGSPHPTLFDGITVCTLVSKALHNRLSATALKRSPAIWAASLPRQRVGLKDQ